MCTVPEVDELDLTGIDTVAVDLETYDPNLLKKGSGAVTGDGYVCGIAIGTSKQNLYFPIRHAMTSNLDVVDTWTQLNKILFQNEKIKKVFHNAMYDVCWIRASTGEMPKGPLLDTMIAASVIDENRMRYSLDAVSKDYLKDAKKSWDLKDRSLAEHGIKDPMSNMHKLPYSLVKDYAEQDVNLTLKLWEIFNQKLDEIIYEPAGKSLRKIFNLETKLFPCLVDMKFNGVRIDVKKAEKLGKFLEKRRDNLVALIAKRTGIKVDIWASSSIKKLLDHQGIKDYKKTPKSGAPQLPKDYLQTHSDRFLRMIAKARECDKAKGTFVEGLLSYVHKGKIHADINQIRSEGGGTVTGRFSMSNPNLQQIPAKGYIGKKMRELFLPEEGHVWGSFDYSQQEPRIVVHYAIKLLKNSPELLQLDIPEQYRNKKFQAILKSIKKIETYYKEDPSADFHKLVAKMAGISRIEAKTISLGMFYGMGKIKLQKELRLEKDEAKELFNKYHDEVPFVKRLTEDLIEFASENELLFTVGDRFCRFNKWETTKKTWNNKLKRYDPVALLTKEQAVTEYRAYLQKQNEEVDKLIKDDPKKYSDEDKIKDPDLEYLSDRYVPAFTYKALNKLIQGGAADMTKTAMVKLYEQGILPHIQIHDELCISIKDDKQSDIVKKTMEGAILLSIDNKVTYKKGKDWGSAK